MDNTPEWHGRLSQALERSGMSKRGVSLKAGLGPNYVQQLLNGRNDATVGNLIALSRVLGTSVSALIGEQQ